MTREHPTEHAEQVSLMRMVRLHEPRFPALKLLFAVGNGGHRHKATAARMKMEGIRPGVPDLMLPFPAGEFHGLAIELKSRSGYPSREQKDWIERLRANGYRAEVCRGWEQAWGVLCEYLGIPKAGAA